MSKPPEYVEKFDFEPIVVRNPLIRFFGGLTFGLVVLTLILIASTIGEFLPQDENSQMALELVFKTWWFRALLFIQGINLLLNTYMTYVEETYPQYMPIFRKNADGFKPLKIKHKVNFKDAKVEDSKSLMESLANAFHARGYRTFFDGNSIYAHRGLIARFGSTVTHLGLITIIVGALAESLLKVEGTVALAEGETTEAYHAEGELLNKPPTHPLGIKVTLHDFDFTEYPGTTIASKYKSTMTFEGASEEPLHDYVRVNHDITYGGWTFHQNSYNELQTDPVTRYFVSVKEKLPDGKSKSHHLEMYAYPQGRELKPLPGHDNLFVSLESDPASRGVIWTVTSKEKILARGTKSAFGDLKIEMLRFYPDFQVSEDGWIVNASNQPNNPAAQIEISSDNTVIYRDWVHPDGSQYNDTASAGESMIDLVMLDHQILPESASAAPVGKLDSDEMLASGVAMGAPVEKRAIVTVSLRSAQTGQPVGQPYKLMVGESVPLAEASDPRYAIPGDFELETLKAVPTYVSYMSVSKNPGIPIVWLGAIFATFGPVLAFFVSRRRVWATVDMNKKQIWFGGESRYSRDALSDELAEVVGAWSASEPVAIEPPIKLSDSGSTEVLEVQM